MKQKRRKKIKVKNEKSKYRFKKYAVNKYLFSVLMKKISNIIHGSYLSSTKSLI